MRSVLYSFLAFATGSRTCKLLTERGDKPLALMVKYEHLPETTDAFRRKSGNVDLRNRGVRRLRRCIAPPAAQSRESAFAKEMGMHLPVT